MRRWRWVWLGIAILFCGGFLWNYAPSLWPRYFPPRTPPAAPPPGRPFVTTPITYTNQTPTRQALRAVLKGTNVILCVLDAARVDHFSAYGYPRQTTPNFDRLAKESVLFEQHFCEAPQTRVSTASLLTGLYPETHGLLENHSPIPLPAATFTLEQGFAQAGYATYLLSSNPIASPFFGLGADFQHFLSLYRTNTTDLVAHMQASLHHVMPQWRVSKTPFFAYLHVLPPHLPYAAPETYTREISYQRPPRYWQSRNLPRKGKGKPTGQPDGSWQNWINAYDANLRWADSFVGALTQELQQAGLLERTLLIITADHGEALLEYGYSFHLTCPYDEALHIPLLIRFPGKSKVTGRVHALTETVDVLPTLLDVYGLSTPQTVQGKSLAPLWEGKTRAAHSYLISSAGTFMPSYVVRDPRFTLLLGPNGQKSLYDMDRDPWQSDDIYSEQRAQAAPLERALTAYLHAQQRTAVKRPSSRPAAPPALTAAQRRTLKSLGYVQ